MTTSTLTKEIQFDAGHRVPDHESKCKHPHGHRYRVVVTASGPIPGDGMVVDFGILKAWMNEHIHDVYDHTMIIHDDDTEFVDAMDGHGWNIRVIEAVPTAENLAWIFHQVLTQVAAINEPLLTIDQVTVWETPTSSATFGL